MEWATAGVMVLIVAAVVGLEFAVYSVTRNRVLEFAVVAAAAPVVFLLLRSRYAKLPAPQPNQLALLRMNTVVLTLMPLMVALDVWLVLRHGEAGSSGNFSVALGFLSMTLMPQAAYFTYVRYARSNATPAR